MKASVATRSKMRLLAWVLVSLLVLGIGGFFAYRRIRAIGTVPGTEDPRGFAFHGDHGYVLADPELGQHALWSVQLSGDARTLLHSGHGASQALAADDRWVVWSLCDGVNEMPCPKGRTLAVPVAGGKVRLLVDGGAAQTIALGGGRAYLLIKGNARVVDLSEDKEAFSCCRTALSDPTHDVGADDTHGYWLTSTKLTRAPHGQVSTETLADGLMNARSMALGPRGVYVVCDGPQLDDDEIRHVPFDGSAITVVAKGLRGIDRPVRWGDWLAFVHDVPLEPGSNAARMTLSVVPLSGGDLKTLETRFTGRLVGDGSRLYSMYWDRVRALNPP